MTDDNQDKRQISGEKEGGGIVQERPLPAVPRKSRAVVAAIEKLTADIVALSLAVPEEFSYQAGQYAKIRFSEDLPLRAYSIASPVLPDVADNNNLRMLDVHVKADSAGQVSRYVLSDLKEKDEIYLQGPFGQNIFDPADNRPLLLVAGGLGITALKSIAQTALASGYSNPVFLYWGTQAECEQYLAEELIKMAYCHDNFHFCPVIGGSVVQHVLNDFDNVADFRIHLAGPPAMVKAALPDLTEKGADRNDIYFDPFE